MKRLFLYFNKEGKLDHESEILQRIQIDLCTALGYKNEDIAFVSNIPFEYNGVKSIVYNPKDLPEFTKHVKGWLISTLFKEKILQGTYWVTDHDVYQVSELPDKDYPEGAADLAIYGVSTTGRIPHKASEVNLCCAFVSEKSIPFFDSLRATMATAKNRKLKSEERAATWLNDSTVKYLDKRYNLFAWNNMKEQCAIMEGKPIAIHFHPSHVWAMAMMCLDSNKLGFIPASPLLIDILKEHGFTAKHTEKKPEESYGA